MKRYLFTLSLIFVSLTAIISLCSWDYAPLESTSHNASGTTADEDWILIGEVTLSNYNTGETIKGNLYVREIANKLIYRVEYQGSYYATRWHDSFQIYLVTINGKNYKCDVPAISNGNTSTDQPQNTFIGVWKAVDRDFGDIQISNKDGKLFVQMKKTNGLQSKFATCNNNYIEWSIDLNVDYGEWRVSNKGYGQVIEGNGINYTDRMKPDGTVTRESSLANKEVLREQYKASIKDGNLNISISYKYYYFYDNRYCFSCNEHYRINNVIYTKW